MARGPLQFRWRTRPGVTIAPDGAEALAITVDGETSARLRPGAALAAALARFGAADGVGEEEIVAAAGGDAAAVARAHYALRRFVGNGLLVCDVLDGGAAGGAPLATVLPRRRDFALEGGASAPGAGGPPTQARLSRFALLRRDGDALLLACPGAGCELLLHDERAAGWFAAAAFAPVAVEREPSRADADAAARSDTGDDDAAARTALLRLALAHGLLEAAEAQESPAEASWEFHDRLFHHAARSFDDLVVRGGTFRFDGTLPSPPAIRPPHAGAEHALPAVEEDASSQPLREVMERRRSRREMSEQPLPLRSLAAVLWRVARTTAHDRTGPQETIRRPYPSGGSLHELELYVAVGRCEGLEPGFYHYRGDAHALTQLPGAAAPAAAMLDGAARAWGQEGAPPQVLVVLASRLPRLAWKYSGIAYKVSLLNAGVAIQSLSLVTTDLGLAGAAVGSGDPGLFAQATGCDPFEETSIAEFGFGAAAGAT
ncbi:MAG TPA: SagB family peptide dehydrogenase [Conexibacter sp.]|nr:SagB family peptide dehydrogenase [Conexibacter sp.]